MNTPIGIFRRRGLAPSPAECGRFNQPIICVGEHRLKETEEAHGRAPSENARNHPTGEHRPPSKIGSDRPRVWYQGDEEHPEREEVYLLAAVVAGGPESVLRELGSDRIDLLSRGIIAACPGIVGQELSQVVDERRWHSLRAPDSYAREQFDQDRQRGDRERHHQGEHREQLTDVRKQPGEGTLGVGASVGEAGDQDEHSRDRQHQYLNIEGVVGRAKPEAPLLIVDIDVNI
jgi:hypothetical protein